MNNSDYVSNSTFVNSHADILTYLSKGSQEILAVDGVPIRNIRVDELLKLRYEEITGKPYLGKTDDSLSINEKNAFAKVICHLRQLPASCEVPVMSPDLFNRYPSTDLIELYGTKATLGINVWLARNVRNLLTMEVDAGDISASTENGAVTDTSVLVDTPKFDDVSNLTVIHSQAYSNIPVHSEKYTKLIHAACDSHETHFSREPYAKLIEDGWELVTDEDTLMRVNSYLISNPPLTTDRYWVDPIDPFYLDFSRPKPTKSGASRISGRAQAVYGEPRVKDAFDLAVDALVKYAENSLNTITIAGEQFTELPCSNRDYYSSLAVGPFKTRSEYFDTQFLDKALQEGYEVVTDAERLESVRRYQSALQPPNAPVLFWTKVTEPWWGCTVDVDSNSMARILLGKR